ncbi:hypothetical protein K2173_014922 [Erythroxylum novogranatense]|uniref:Pesticidal crystal cry8Ba protein n=1 Tax=Erythroxylum novogranatense TaxID=1862640 RepID=A0AAV8THT7_9ROSI|nr:hypothetical protein K2173_014922 [Erythroxylum novogranatense]
MYTDRWGRDGGGVRGGSIFNSILTEKPNSDPFGKVRKDGQGFGLPSSAKFRSGHLTSAAIHVSKTSPVYRDDGGSGSDMDLGSDSDSEDEAYGVPHSVDTSPQDDKIRNGRISQEKNIRKDMPSAPPMGSGAEIKHRVEKISTFSANMTPHLANMNSSVVSEKPKLSERIAVVKEAMSPSSFPARVPTFHASGQGPWCAVISYDACVRLCLHSWAKGCTEEAPFFLDKECALLRDAFGVQQSLLQPEEELLAKRSVELVSQKAAPKSKKNYAKLKVQVRSVKMGLDSPPSCNFLYLNPHVMKIESIRRQISNLNSTLFSGWEEVRKVRVNPRVPPNGSFSQQSMAYVRASTQYIKEVSRLIKSRTTTLRTSPSSYEVVQEQYTCSLRLKSQSDEDSVRVQPGTSESLVFFPEKLGDDLIIELQDSKGQCCGRGQAQVAAIADDSNNKLRWWPIFHEPDHEVVGRIQLNINYSITPDESSHQKCGCVAETVAYDFVLEVAMKMVRFQQRKLLLHGPWKWLVTEFASYYGVSDAYTKLRYLSYVMDVATPTKDCLELVYDLLHPVVMKGNRKSALSHQENRIFGEVEDQIHQVLALAFENYKSLDELSPSGMMDVFAPATGLAAPALAPAVKLYTLLHDILTPEAQLAFSRYFQAAARKRSRRHLAETDELINSNEASLIDPVAFPTAYQKMKSLILNIKNEIYTDIQIHNHHLLPSFIDLPNLCASLYGMELSARLRTFLIACPPSSPSLPVAELVIATADFQRDLESWNINPAKGGVDAKELFHSYITLWIKDKRHTLLEMCKLDKVKWSGVKTQNSTTPFVEEMYTQLKETLNEYEVIIRQWPEYIVVLGNALADVEKAIIEALDKQYADVLSPLKDSFNPKLFGLKYVQKLSKRTGEIYFVPDELGILLNSMKWMLDVLGPKIETQLKSWSSCIPEGVNAVTGECLSEITVMLRSKFRSYLQAIVEMLVQNTKLQSATKLKKIIQDSKEPVAESDVRSRMQPLKDLLIKTIDHLQTVVESQLFITICRGFWDRLGQEVLNFLQDRRENRSSYKGSRIAVSILDDIFASQMQQLLGNALQEKDLEPPRSIMEARAMLCKDAVNNQDNNYYY